MDEINLITLFLGAIFVNNFVLSKFLGICPFLGVSKKVETAVGMGVAVTFVMTIASAATCLVYNYVLIQLKLQYLYNIAFILIIASLVQFIEMFIKKSSPTLYQALGVYLPLITTNCAVLGVTVSSMEDLKDMGNVAIGMKFTYSLVYGVGAALGFTLAIVLFAGIRERLERNNILPAVKGFPIALITAGLMSISFLGFSGLL
ncbi:MAG: RnfABCDGE type electron transport complex subunit A [Clostridiales bacterium]|nr:RnfABCDGE type electron transport complex subunit A [Clostridiales bacterium]